MGFIIFVGIENNIKNQADTLAKSKRGFLYLVGDQGFELIIYAHSPLSWFGHSLGRRRAHE